MCKLINETAFKMEIIKSYGIIHLSYFIIGVFISVLIAIKLRNISRKNLNRTIFMFGVFLLIFEVYKQLFYTCYIGAGFYQWWIFPFQLCSIPMYLCLIIPFIKNEKIYKCLLGFLISYNLLGGFISFLEPSGLIHEYLFLTIHAFLWHMSLVTLGLIIAFNRDIKYKLKDFSRVIILFVILCIVAFVINLMFWKPSEGDINMFFIGPKISPLVVYKTIATKFGWFVNAIIYMITISLGAFLFYYPFTKLKK